MVGQRVRVRVSDRWEAGTVETVCPEPHSYVVRLNDGRAFRRTRHAINIDHSSSAGFGVPKFHQRNPRRPMNVLLPSIGPPASEAAAVPPAQPEPVIDGTPTRSCGTPGRSFASVAASPPEPPSSEARQPSTSSRSLKLCPNPNIPSGYTRSGLHYLKPKLN